MSTSLVPQSDTRPTLRPLVFNAAAELEKEERLYFPIRPLGEWVDHRLQVNYTATCGRCEIACQASATTIFREVGTDLDLAESAQKRLYTIGLESTCKHCSHWNLSMAECLDYHAEMIRARLVDDTALLIKMAAKKSCILRSLGYSSI